MTEQSLGGQQQMNLSECGVISVWLGQLPGAVDSIVCGGQIAHVLQSGCVFNQSARGIFSIAGLQQQSASGFQFRARFAILLCNGQRLGPLP